MEDLSYHQFINQMIIKYFMIAVLYGSLGLLFGIVSWMDLFHFAFGMVFISIIFGFIDINKI